MSFMSALLSELEKLAVDGPNYQGGTLDRFTANQLMMKLPVRNTRAFPGPISRAAREEFFKNAASNLYFNQARHSLSKPKGGLLSGLTSLGKNSRPQIGA